MLPRRTLPDTPARTTTWCLSGAITRVASERPRPRSSQDAHPLWQMSNTLTNAIFQVIALHYSRLRAGFFTFAASRRQCAQKMQDEGTAGSVHIGVMVGGFCELPALKMVGEALEVPVPGQRFSTRRVDGSVPYLLQMPVSRFSARQVDGHPAARSVRARIRPGLWGGSAAAGPASRCRSRRRCCRIRRLRPCRCRRSNHPP